MSPHQTIAHYRIASKLGEGGMGAAYRATDTKLGRDVAIKVLAEGYAQDAMRMARFEREALALASLNHPNIAAIYGIEKGAIVMNWWKAPTSPDPFPSTRLSSSPNRCDDPGGSDRSGSRAATGIVELSSSEGTWADVSNLQVDSGQWCTSPRHVGT